MKKPKKLRLLTVAEWCKRTKKEYRFQASVDRVSYNKGRSKMEAYHKWDIKKNYIKKDITEAKLLKVIRNTGADDGLPLSLSQKLAKAIVNVIKKGGEVDETV